VGIVERAVKLGVLCSKEFGETLV